MKLSEHLTIGPNLPVQPPLTHSPTSWAFLLLGAVKLLQVLAVPLLARKLPLSLCGFQQKTHFLVPTNYFLGFLPEQASY